MLLLCAQRFLTHELAEIASQVQPGLLILYPIAPSESRSEDGATPIIGFAISFPSVDVESSSRVTYRVNNVYQQMELGLD